ncbi:unnamed protein product [Cyclocybe aegerita]|uniref:Uncharacterized protein n=1 Tax=Cyclocybe aegerita TaxID=1973307 RepID=A0A8S0W819_CYCAE|nr:unnamed protein product [Cyclocybe aegerita]
MSECDFNPNPDMQGFAVRLAIFLTHSGMALLLGIVPEEPDEHIRMCFYALFFQLFPIIIGTLISFIQRKLSPGDAWFALLVMLSPTTLEMLDLLPFHRRRAGKWSLREIADGICIILLLVLSIALYIIIVVFLSRQGDECQLGGFYSIALGESRTGYHVSFAIALFTVFLTIFRIPGYQTMKFLLQVLLWAPSAGYEAFWITSIVFSILSAVQTLGATQPGCVVARWRLQNAHSPHAKSRLLPIIRRGVMLGFSVMTILIFIDPTQWVARVAIGFCLLGELAIALPARCSGISWVQISASWIHVTSEAAERIHPRRSALLSVLFYAQWGLTLGVTTLEPDYELTYGQIVASLSFLPIAAECLKLAFQKHHWPSLRSLRLVLLPLSPSQYKELSEDDVFPNEFWKNKTRTAVVASILGLSWVGCTVPDRLPKRTTMRTVVYYAFPSIRFPEVLEDTVCKKPEDSNSHLHLHNKPIEMKTMLPSSLPRTPLSSDSATFLSGETIVDEPDSLSYTEESVVVMTGRQPSMQSDSGIRSRTSLPRPVTTPHRRAFNALWWRR